MEVTVATTWSIHHVPSTRARVSTSIVAALALACARGAVASGDATQDAATNRSEISPARVKGRSLPESLPADKLPSVRGCDPDRTESTRDQCIAWAAYIVEYHNRDWDRFAREMLAQMCRSRCWKCCEIAANLLEVGIGGAGGASEEQELRDQACRLGRKDQCVVNVERRRAEERERRARLLRACDARDAVACLDYGITIWDQDMNAVGLEFFDKACSLGNADGCIRAKVARIALKGEGPW